MKSRKRKVRKSRSLKYRDLVPYHLKTVNVFRVTENRVSVNTVRQCNGRRNEENVPEIEKRRKTSLPEV